MPSLAILILSFPAVASLVLIAAWWFQISMPERLVARIVMGAFLVSALSGLVTLIRLGGGSLLSNWGEWYHLAGFEYTWRIALDPLSLTMVVLSSLLLAVIAAFSQSYLHQETGYMRFYILNTLLGLGVLLILVSGSLEEVFFGWELVGLSSALLIAFFSHRVGPARSGIRAFLTYRICDIGLLAAVVWMHHHAGSAAIQTSGGPWFGLAVPQSSMGATLIVALLLFACMGKSALVPFGGWLPRAMEGPTPSSAVFYGALSIHLGPYLMLRAWPLLDISPVGSALVVIVGALTAMHGTLVGRVQSDAKSALAYGSMTQVGLIFVEIGLGLRWFAVIHIIGHACLRTLELLRAPSLLHDYTHIEKSLGEVLPRMGMHYEHTLPKGMQMWLYRSALERGFFDMYLLHLLGLWKAFASALDRADRGWQDLLTGAQDGDNVEAIR